MGEDGPRTECVYCSAPLVPTASDSSEYVGGHRGACARCAATREHANVGLIVSVALTAVGAYCWYAGAQNSGVASAIELLAVPCFVVGVPLGLWSWKKLNP